MTRVEQKHVDNDDNIVRHNDDNVVAANIVVVDDDDKFGYNLKLNEENKLSLQTAIKPTPLLSDRTITTLSPLDSNANFPW